MRLKVLFFLLSMTLFISIEPALADRSYPVTLTNAAKVGSVELKPGEYRLVLDGSSAHFAHQNTGKKIKVLATIDDTAGKKFDKTEIHSTRANGEVLITEIRLGGTTTRVAFN